MLDSILSIVIPAGIILFAFLVIGLMFAKLYRKTTKEMSFVRTGFGGEKVVMNGGALILPVLHDIIFVNMQTLKLTVLRAREDSLITKNKMRVDITADFYVRVKQDKDSISKAAQTLGTKTMNPAQLKELIEGKFVDALRSVASSMAMDDLHEKRAEFVQEVQTTLFEDLLKNGLELESVSLTTFDQTELQYFNENNAFDAEGLTVLTKVIQERKKIRNDIEKQTEVEIQQKDLESKKKSLDLDQEKAFAEAEQRSKIAENAANRKKEAEAAEIAAEREIEQARIEKDKTLRAKEIEAEKELDIAKQNKAIALSKKSEEESEAKSLANEKKAREVESEEKILTAKQLEDAERKKKLAIISAEQEAEEEAIGKKVAAAAEKEAAADYAEAITIKAQGEADAVTIKASADKEKYEVEAEGKSKLNSAENTLSAEIIQMRLQEALIAAMPTIIKEVVSPMQNIDSIKIVDMGGVGSTSGSTVEGKVVENGSLSDQIVNSALKYQVHSPVLKDLLNQVGLDTNSIAGLTKPLEGIINTGNVKRDLLNEDLTKKDIKDLIDQTK